MHVVAKPDYTNVKFVKGIYFSDYIKRYIKPNILIHKTNKSSLTRLHDADSINIKVVFYDMYAHCSRSIYSKSR